MKNQQTKPEPSKPIKPSASGVYNTETGKKIETSEDFRKAFRKRQLVIKL